MSLLMSVAIISVVAVKFKNFRSKAEFEITELQTSSQQNGSIDLNQNEQTLMIEHWPEFIPYNKILYTSSVHVREAEKGGAKVVTPLRIVPCSERTIKGKPVKLAQECVVFDKPTMIGSVSEAGSTHVGKEYI